MRSDEIRAHFIDYFKALGHRHVPSAPLVPADDPTLLFTNAGMNQFKDVFLGAGKREYSRAVNSQKCMRVSGKHNDLEDVGADTYHHTFFEMLGNWSFGDYYKREAIEWAWRLLTREWKIPPGRLRATVFEKDDESARIWGETIGTAAGGALRFGEKENFWEMAETGPCGPCSEIHIDMGERHCRRRGQPAHRCEVNGDCGRFIEIWNLVFIQYNRDEGGALRELPKRHVDTGMGFERVAAVLQGVDSNYATDLFVPIIAAVEEASGKRFDPGSPSAAAFRAISDHARALSFAIADGALPSNDGRGYVLRMILRRAVRYGRTLGIEQPFLHALVPVVADTMGGTYPELRLHREHVERVVLSEEERFNNTLTFGLELLGEVVRRTRERGEGAIRGEDVFKLYDTYGFPADLTALIAREEGLSVDGKAFESLMEGQKERARASWKAAPAKAVAAVYRDIAARLGGTPFSGYGAEAADTTIAAIIKDGAEVSALPEGEEGELVLETTPFYAESGGQVGDRGRVSGGGATAIVTEARSPLPGLVVHRAKTVAGTLRRGERIRAEVDAETRAETARCHTGTHLLQHALRLVLGEHVKQAGSLVEPGRLRFDFTHFTAMSPREIERVEEIVNARIRENAPVGTYEMPFEEARTRDIIAIFGEKYGDSVRVVDVGGYSRELCGGTHVRAAGEIGLFTILGESSVAAGVRRIEALCGNAAWRLARRRAVQVQEISRLFRTDPEDVVERVEALRVEAKRLRKSAAADPGGGGEIDAEALVARARDAGGARLVAAELGGARVDALRAAGDRVRRALGRGVVLLGSTGDGRANLVCMVTEDLVGRGLNAGAIVKELAKIIGGSGGGRPQMAQAGGRSPEKLGEALASAPGLIERSLKQVNG
jgi:alanyl-tRNA synthetase